MRLEMKLRNVGLTAEQMETVERRTHFALGRFGQRIRRIEVTFGDANGPRGGRDKRCTVQVLLSGLPPLLVEVTDVEAMAAVSRAVDRAARQVRDTLNRRRDMQRLRGSHMRPRAR